jgi:predicted nucleic-acid-binding protein
MIGIDTNILIRYIVQDDKRQAIAASRFIEGTCSEESPGFINIIVFCELVWVLSQAYKFPRSDIVTVIKQIMVTNCFEIQYTQLIWNALSDYEDEGGDFADYIIAYLNKSKGIEFTVTFDKKASKHACFRLLK